MTWPSPRLSGSSQYHARSARGLSEAVATAAVREAANGREFVARVRETCGLEVRVLSGVDEARLSALGAMSAIPDADGVMGDLGGGSLELVVLNSGEIGGQRDAAAGGAAVDGLTPEERIAVIDQALDEVAWLNKLKKKEFLRSRRCLALTGAHSHGAA